MPESRYLTRIEAAKYLRLSERWVASETSKGNLPASKVGRRVLYNIDDLDEYMRQRLIKPGDDLSDVEQPPQE